MWEQSRQPKIAWNWIFRLRGSTKTSYKCPKKIKMLLKKCQWSVQNLQKKWQKQHATNSLKFLTPKRLPSQGKPQSHNCMANQQNCSSALNLCRFWKGFGRTEGEFFNRGELFNRGIFLICVCFFHSGNFLICVRFFFHPKFGQQNGLKNLFGVFSSRSCALDPIFTALWALWTATGT